ncbi:MAG: serine/threonine protein kinase [Lachnospiraceae bacterium]|nr:serine/threonine protein kinase [Lachnospiraceae bacterium]
MLEIGSLVDGKYKILNKVGQGGMSVVYLAMNEKANKQWAVKEVRKDGVLDFESVKQGLVAETDILKKLNHPNLPSIIDVIDQDDSFIIIMDYIQGNSLNRALDEFGAQPQELVIDWAKQLCDVLGYLHSRTPAIIYRDMKPANVMLKPDGNVMLIDFGTAREYKEKNLADTTCLGTVGYAAPEQFGGMGQTDARTDIYCLGATLYHLVTGMNPCEPPYEIKPIREINPTLSSGLERIIQKCTQRNPEDRYQSCAELMYALEHYEEIDDIHRKKQKKQLSKFIVSAAMTVVLGITSAVSYMAAENKKSENYDEILRVATETADYYEAILTDSTKTDAYLQFNEYLIDDFVLTKEEGHQLIQLRSGLDQKKASGFSENINVLENLRLNNPEGYQDVCYEIGSTFLFYYDLNIDRDRYSNAAKWFEGSKEKYAIAEIYCDIANCLELINQYNGSKIKQTEKMYEEYGSLWEMIQELKGKADEFDSVDSKLQVWNEINGMINTNIAPFLEVTDKTELTNLLNVISEDAGKVNKSVIEEDIKALQNSITETIKKIDSAIE